MNKGNLIVLLESLSAYELNRVHKFISSPYFNKSSKIIALFEALKKDLNKSKIKDKEYYYKLATGEKSYSDQKFRNLASDLFQLCLQFLAQEEYEENEQHKANNLITSVDKRELKPLYSKAINTANKWIARNNLRDGNHFLQSFYLEKNIFNLESEFERKIKTKKKNREVDVLRINDNLDYFYMIEKLKYYNTYLSHKRLFESEYEFPYIDKVLAIVKMHQKDLPPVLRIYYEIYKTSINSDDTDSYRNLKILIKRYYHLFDTRDAKTIHESLINFTIRQINKGNADFYQEMLDVYSEGIENKAILEKGKLSPTSYRNIVSIALRLKKIDWTKQFIEDKINLLDEKFQDNAYQYNLAVFHFYKKDYKRVIETVRNVEFEDPLYANVSKTMLMVSYYELYDEEALMYFSDSFSAYMRRSKGISEKIRREYLNLIKYMKTLNKARYNPDLLPKLKQKILDTKELASRQWFLEKLKDIKLPNET